MGFDWKKLEREDAERSERVSLHLGLVYAALAVVGLVFTLVTGSDRVLGSLVVWVCLGGVLLGGTLGRRRRKG